MEFIMSILPLAALFIAMWFIIIRPAMKRQRAAADLQNSLKIGDQVVTIGGLHGEIIRLEEKEVVLKCAENFTVAYERQAIARVITAQ